MTPGPGSLDEMRGPAPENEEGARAIIVGYASLDRAVRVDRCPGPGTTGIVRKVVNTTRRSGGVAYTALSLASGGLDVSVVTALGSDAGGEDYLKELEAAGCDTSGVQLQGDLSPSTDLLYADDGSTACLFNPGTTGAWELDRAKTALIGEVDLAVCMVAPAPVTRAVLDALPDETILGWVIKDDQEALGGGLNRRLSQRADLIFCNRTERALVDTSALDSRTIVVQTNGTNNVELSTGAEFASHPVPVLDPAPTDPTGAGDAFAGGFLAAYLSGATANEAVDAALLAATRLLESRANEENIVSNQR